MSRTTKEKFKVREGVFDEFTIKTLELLQRRKEFDELQGPIKTGKEGNVYLATKNNSYVAIKIYRINTANFNKISEYIQKDIRFKNLKGNIRKIILRWAQKEYRNLLISHNKEVRVPTPYKFLNNIVIMEYINGSMLKDINLKNPKKFIEKLKNELKKLILNAKLIHSDLSEYNILVDQKENPVIIDFGQAFSFKTKEDFLELNSYYQRDIKNLENFFKKKYNLEFSFNIQIK